MNTMITDDFRTDVSATAPRPRVALEIDRHDAWADEPTGLVYPSWVPTVTAGCAG